MTRSVYFSTFPYAAVKACATPAAWAAQLKTELASPDASAWPGFRTLGQAQKLGDAGELDSLFAYVDGSTYITRARCVAAGHFLAASAYDVWMTVDDDVFVEASVLLRMLRVLDRTRGFVALPYLNRDGESMTFRRVSGPTRRYGEGLAVRHVDRIGMGCVVMHRSFVEALAAGEPRFEAGYPAIFLEGVRDVDPRTGSGVWVGEDYWMGAIAEEKGLPLDVLLSAPCEHQGMAAMLDDDGLIRCRSEVDAAKLEAGIARKNAEHAKRVNGFEPAEPSTKR